MNKFAACAVVFLSVSIVCGIHAQERYLMPVDDAGKDPTFAAFRSKLIDAAERRDARYVYSILDPNIRVTFGDNHGVADFKRIWKIEDSKSEFWNELLIVLRNGGKFSKGGRSAPRQFWAPYVFSNFPEDLDAFEHAAILGKDVNLRRTADTNGEIVGSLSYNLVKVDRDGSVRENDGETLVWTKVMTFGGKTGFVKSEYVRSPVDYRAAFEKRRGQWKMTIFIAGD